MTRRVSSHSRGVLAEHLLAALRVDDQPCQFVGINFLQARLGVFLRAKRVSAALPVDEVAHVITRPVVRLSFAQVGHADTVAGYRAYFTRPRNAMAVPFEAPMVKISITPPQARHNGLCVRRDDPPRPRGDRT